MSSEIQNALVAMQAAIIAIGKKVDEAPTGLTPGGVDSDGVKWRHAVNRVADLIEGISRRYGMMTKDDLRRACAARDRVFFTEAFTLLLDQGRIVDCGKAYQARGFEIPMSWESAYEGFCQDQQQDERR